MIHSRISLSAFRRPRRHRPPIARDGATRVLAAFKVSRRDAPIDTFARRCYTCRCSVPYIAVADQICRATVMAVSPGLWRPVPVLAAGVLGVIVFATTAAAAIHEPASAGASTAILKRSGRKVVHHWAPLALITLTHTHAHRQLTLSPFLFTPADAFSYLISCGLFLFLFFLLVSFSLSFSSFFY